MFRPRHLVGLVGLGVVVSLAPGQDPVAPLDTTRQDKILIAPPPGTTADGFTPLFDGKTFDGWVVPQGDNGHWKIIDGVIDYDARSEAIGSKNLVTVREFKDFVLKLDWRIKETPWTHPSVPYILPDGTHAKGPDGQEIKMAIPDSDSGVFLRDLKTGKSQVNIWCWPIGSGEVYGYREDPDVAPDVRAGVTPKHQADRPVGQWNTFEITLKGDRLTVVLNSTTVIENAQLPGIPDRGPIGLQHHGVWRDGGYFGSPSLVQFRNLRIKPLP